MTGADCSSRARPGALPGRRRRSRYAQDGTPLIDIDFLLLVNAWWEPLEFVVPATEPDETWAPEVDTYEPRDVTAPAKLAAGDQLTVHPRSIMLLQGHRTAEPP